MNTDISVIKDYLPILTPLILLQMFLMIIALIKVLKRDTFRNLNKTTWIFIIIFINIIGPICYFVSEEF